MSLSCLAKPHQKAQLPGWEAPLSLGSPTVLSSCVFMSASLYSRLPCAAAVGTRAHRGTRCLAILSTRGIAGTWGVIVQALQFTVEQCESGHASRSPDWGHLAELSRDCQEGTHWHVTSGASSAPLSEVLAHGLMDGSPRPAAWLSAVCSGRAEGQKAAMENIAYLTIIPRFVYAGRSTPEKQETEKRGARETSW